MLIDGSVFHTRCLEDLKRHVEDLKAGEHRLQTELQKPLSFFQNISAIFSESRRTDLLAEKQRISSLIRSARQDREAIIGKIRQLYDAWPSYPPDWEERKAQINARYDYSCSECGVSGRLHLHHIRALSQGGSHRLDNIALLCEDCHSAAHGGRTFRYEDRDKPTTIERKITLLNRAISQRKDIRFRYQKPDGTITHRMVTPRELRKLSIRELRTLVGAKVKIEKEGTLCLFGYCHLRRADRTFAVHRMQKIQV